MRPAINNTLLNKTAAALINNAGDNARMKNAVQRGAQLIRDERCEIVDDERIRVYSESGHTYTTSLSECTNEGTGEDCPAFFKGFPCKHRAALHLLMLILAEQEKQFECANCNTRFKQEDLLPVDFSRLVAGDTVPSGLCPECDCFCFPADDAGSVH